LVEKYRSNETLVKCWDAALSAGIPPEECAPEGATNPRAKVPDDGLFSEFILRAFEAGFDIPNDNDPFPRAGFKPQLRVIAKNLETACRIAAEGYKVDEFSRDLVPLKWLRDAAEFAYYRSAPGVKNPLAELDKELRAEGNRYPYLSALWQAWFEPFTVAQDNYSESGW
jgi:hypothetical protein